MLTNFQKNRDDFDRMDGQSQEEMHSGLRDWMSTAHEQRILLWRFAHLVEVLTVDDIPRVQSANLILRLIHDHVLELSKFFSHTPASNVLEGALKSLNSDLEEADRFTRQIMKFVPEIMSLTAIESL